MKLPPHTIETSNPKEAISYGISVGIEMGILSPTFKMSHTAWDSLFNYLDVKWNTTEHKQLAQMIECFTVGYAVGTNQFLPAMEEGK